MDIDVAGVAIASLGVFAGCISLTTAVAEYRACMEAKVNGATLLSAKAQSVKALLLALAQATMVYRISQVVSVPGPQLSVEAFTATTLTALVTIADFYFHGKLYAKVRPQNAMRRRTSD